jgi:hypothetical protein
MPKACGNQRQYSKAAFDILEYLKRIKADGSKERRIVIYRLVKKDEPDLNSRIQKFTNTGKFIRKWGTEGSGNGQFQDPNGVAVDSAGNAFVSDGDNNRIQKFTNTGKFIRKWGSFGSESIAVTGANPSDENTSKQLTPFAFSIEK